MICDPPIRLVREIHCAGTHTYPQYNHNLVREAIRDIQQRFDEAWRIISNGCLPDSPEMTQVLIIHLMLKRNRRCLLAYHYHRLKRLIMCQKGRVEEIDELVDFENVFASKYNSLLTKIRREYVGFGLFGPETGPPSNLFVKVYATQDIGTIQTEDGTLVLRQDNLSHVKHSTVEHLIAQGLVQQI